MRKQIISQTQTLPEPSNEAWLNLEDLVRIELTSEDAQHPIEQALLLSNNQGWRAATPGVQSIRIFFIRPQALKHIQLHFQNQATERTQEFVLRWSNDEGKTYQDVARQQWNFHAQCSAEMEDYRVQLSAVTTLELTINPDISNNQAFASLQTLRVA